MYSNQIDEVKNYILPGKPLFVYGADPLHRMDICRKAISESGFILIEQSCVAPAFCSKDNIRKAWMTLKNNSIKSSALLITNLSCITDSSPEISQMMFRFIHFYMKNARRRIVLTGYIESPGSIICKAAKQLHIINSKYETY